MSPALNLPKQWSKRPNRERELIASSGAVCVGAGAMEANREAARQAYEAATKKYDEGDDAAALRLAQKSQRLGATDAAAALISRLERFGPGSEAVGMVARVLAATDHFTVLGVTPDVDADGLKKAYRKMCLSLHPDKNLARSADSAFKMVNAAHDTLSDPTKRAVYMREYQVKSICVPASREQMRPVFAPFVTLHFSYV